MMASEFQQSCGIELVATLLQYPRRMGLCTGSAVGTRDCDDVGAVTCRLRIGVGKCGQQGCKRQQIPMVVTHHGGQAPRITTMHVIKPSLRCLCACDIILTMEAEQSALCGDQSAVAPIAHVNTSRRMQQIDVRTTRIYNHHPNQTTTNTQQKHNKTQTKEQHQELR